MYNDELMHHGVKGMKWGVRRFRSRKGSNVPSEPDHEHYTKAHDKTKARSMSDSDLRQRINRLQMESQYKQLTSRQKSAGEQIIGNVLKESAKEIAKTYVTKYAKKGIEAAIKMALTK